MRELEGIPKMMVKEEPEIISMQLFQRTRLGQIRRLWEIFLQEDEINAIPDMFESIEWRFT